jgi:hypothetical protein
MPLPIAGALPGLHDAERPAVTRFTLSESAVEAVSTDGDIRTGTNCHLPFTARYCFRLALRPTDLPSIYYPRFLDGLRSSMLVDQA